MQSNLTPANDGDMDSVSRNGVSFLSNAQETGLAFIPIGPALISLWASCMLLRLLYMRGFKTPMRRILLGLAIGDSFTAVTATLQSFLVPKETSRRLYAIGNDASCSYLGWGFTVSSIAFLYYAALSFYFLMVVKFGMKDPVFARKIEPYLHVIILLLVFSISTIPLALGLYGELTVGVGCWLRATDTCDAACIKKYEGLVGAAPFVFCLAMVTVNNALIFCHVRDTIYDNIKKSQERWKENLKNIRLSLSAVNNRLSLSLRSSGVISSSLHSSAHHSSSRSRGPVINAITKDARKATELAIAKEEKAAKKAAAKEAKAAKKAAEAAEKAAKKAVQQKARENLVKQATASPEQRRKVKRVGIQSLLYCSVFMVTYLWTVVLTAYRNSAENGGSPEMEKVLYPFMFLRAMFVPLMGLWDLLIYVRPRYCTVRDQENAKENGESSFRSLRRVIWDPDAGLIGRGRSGRKRFGSTKTQFYNNSSANSRIGPGSTYSMGSAKSKFGSTFSMGSAKSRPGSTFSMDANTPPTMILERGESQHTQIGMTPTILERGESQISELGALSRDFSARALTQDFSVRSGAVTQDFSVRSDLTTEVTPSPTPTRRVSAQTNISSSTRLTIRLEDSSSEDDLSDDN